MKIAVLFGSFNPVTNAHVSVMKAAMTGIGVQKGLFVRTNGQYLKRKAVKIGDPFYLTEEERREIVEKVCEGEENISFWGFELGGVNPSRYKTLCKIQKQYPDIEAFLDVERPQIYHIYEMRMKDRNKQTEDDEPW